MARNSWKFRKRDVRKVKEQNIEIDYLAPDTVQEILLAMARLELLATGATGAAGEESDSALREAGRRILSDPHAGEPVLKDASCMKRFGGRIEKPGRGWRLYRDFCVYFGIKTLIDSLAKDARTSLDSFIAGVKSLTADGNAERWLNCGGQIIPAEDVERLRADIGSGALGSWDAVHARYNELWAAYPRRKARYAVFTLEQSLPIDIGSMDAKAWRLLLRSAGTIFERLCDSAYASRRKDYEDPFRKTTYDSDGEMAAVLEGIEENPFLMDLKKETKRYTDILGSLGGA
jgi:hypothetical protein